NRRLRLPSQGRRHPIDSRTGGDLNLIEIFDAQRHAVWSNRRMDGEVLQRLAYRTNERRCAGITLVYGVVHYVGDPKTFNGLLFKDQFRRRREAILYVLSVAVDLGDIFRFDDPAAAGGWIVGRCDPVGG